MLEFATPTLLLMLLPAAGAAWFVLRSPRSPGRPYPAPFIHRAARRTWRTRLAHTAPRLLLSGILLAIVALARPQHLHRETTEQVDAIAIEMVLDTSGSMQTPTIHHPPSTIHSPSPTRLDIVRAAFAHFVRQRPHDLIGLVTFGGYALTRAPLTHDHDALLAILANVHVPTATGSPAEQLTAIGDALATACTRLSPPSTIHHPPSTPPLPPPSTIHHPPSTPPLPPPSTIHHPPSTPPLPASRIIILLSDGASNTGILFPSEAALAAARLGIRVYTIGVGTPGADGVDEPLLQRIAETTGGTYAHAADRPALTRALAAIDQLEKTPVEKTVYHRATDLFPAILILATALIAAGAALNITFRRRIL